MQKKWLSWCILAGLLVGFIVACASHPPAPEGNKEAGTWEAKAQAKDLSNNKSYKINLDIIGNWPNSMRMDVSGTMGVSLATMVINKDEVRYALYRQKKFYQGKATDKALLPLFKINLNPTVLMNICFDQPISEPGWSCIIGEHGLVESCAKGQDGPKIRWTERSGDRKRVTISDKNFELQIVYKSFSALDSTKVGSDKNPYQLEPPKDFVRYNIL